ncbi:MAG: hypothetical protein AAFR46_19555 [Pseudomonadota bacterium]
MSPTQVPAASPEHQNGHQNGHMARLRVDLFGGVRVSVDGQPVEIPSAKARALLASLVLGGTGEETRVALAERLWSRRDSSEHQRNSLKRDLKTLVDLFRPLGFDALVGRRQTVHLDLTRTDSDVIEAQRSAERGLAHAVLLTQERPYEQLALGCDDVDPEFSAWLANHGRSLQDAVARALDKALSAAEDDLHRRMDLARAAFNLDRTKQSAAMVLMQTLEDLGDISGALRVYSTLYIAHLTEHDEPPSGRIVEKVEELKLGQQNPAPHSDPAAGEDRQGDLPARLGIEPSDALSDPALRRVMFGVIDALGRRPGQIEIVSSGQAEWHLKITADGAGGGFLQLWKTADERLAWSEPVAGGDIAAMEAVSRRLAGVILQRTLRVPMPVSSMIAADRVGAQDAKSAAVPVPSAPGSEVAEAETFALRLLLSRPDAPASLPDEAVLADPRNPVMQADLGWRALLRGQRRDALAALRQAVAFAGGDLEVLGAAALGLALLDAQTDAVRLVDLLAQRPEDARLRALRGTTLAICGDRRLASVCLADLPESWLLPRMLGAAMADLTGDHLTALTCIGPGLDTLGDGAMSFCDWAVHALPLPETAEPMILRERLAALVMARG